MGNQFSKLEKPSALDLLDEDCWRIVFRKLNGEDLLSCREACKPFHQLLDEREFQQKWKFHLVLPILFEYLQSGNNGFNGHDFHWIFWKHLHSLRLTCKAWQQSVDNYATEGYKSTVNPDLMSNYPLATRFYSSEQIEEFMEMFGECNKNPFPSRTVYISNQQNRDEQIQVPQRIQIAYVEKIGDLLEQFGRHIAKLQLLFQLDFGADPLSLYKLIQRTTPHLADLKSFGIINRRDNDSGLDFYQEMAMTTFIRASPLADLPKLEALQIDSLNPKLEEYILKKFAPQLTRLIKLNLRSPLQKNHAQQFRNLRELSYSLVGNRDILQFLQFLESPLKFLKFDLIQTPLMNTGFLNWNVDKVLFNIKHLPIERLEARLGIIGARGLKIVEAGLELNEYINKSIQTLRITLGVANGGKVSFNFFEALTKLEKLELKFMPPAVFEITHPSEDSCEVVRLNEYISTGRTGTLYQSNVWEKVPSLKILTEKRMRNRGDQENLTYTREEYEERGQA